MAKLNIGPHTHDDPHGPEGEETFDREINTGAVIKTVAAVLIMTAVSALLMWWLLRGFVRFDEKNDERPMPIETAVPQPPPPGPRLQVTPNFSVFNPGAVDNQPDAHADVEDMRILHERENLTLEHPAWVDQGQGKVRIPIEDAMQVIATKGAAPTPMTGMVTTLNAPAAPPEAQPAGSPAPAPAAAQTPPPGH